MGDFRKYNTANKLMDNNNYEEAAIKFNQQMIIKILKSYII